MTRRATIPIPSGGRRSVRCAIYARKSSEEGLDQEFNSLDAQREAAEAYIASQKPEGWVCLPEHYDDGGYTGGNMERPALRRLLADIEAKKVDCVVVYKLDRLSRSLMDFARMMTTFETHGASFVSVTQRFSTADSMGRLMLNVLLSFAQFEREIIGERIRDKLAAQRRKGKWAGGTPVLGYDVDRSGPGPRLLVNPAEATRVRQIFSLYLELGSLLPVVGELARRGWPNKVWTTKASKAKGGKPFDKCSVYEMLTNPLYTGKVRHKSDIYKGEHEAIVTDEVFARVQAQLQRNGRSGASELRNRHGALLRGLLHCKACRCGMVHTFTSRGSKRYRYYTCCKAMKKGRSTCPSGSLPAAEIEHAVVDQIRVVSQDPGLLRDTLAAAKVQAEAGLGELTGERRILERALARCQDDLRRMAAAGTLTSAATARLADLHETVRTTEERLAEIDRQTADIREGVVDEAELAAAFRGFDQMWNALSPKEQAKALGLIIQRVEYDAGESAIDVTFHATGIGVLGGTPMEDAA